MHQHPVTGLGGLFQQSQQAVSHTERAGFPTNCHLPFAGALKVWASLRKPVSPGDVTTQMPTIEVTCRNACTVCQTIARPASNWYCLGLICPARLIPARLPLPAQGINAKIRGFAMATFMRSS